MSAKQVCLATLVTALVGLGAARGQYTPTTPADVGGLATPPSTPAVISTRPGDTTPAADQSQPPPPGQPLNLCLSQWIVGCKEPGCCGPVGGSGPIQAELYVDSGLTFSFADGVFGHTLRSPGWDIGGGGRSLFFNPEETAAWIIDLGISNIRNQGRNPTYEVPLSGIVLPTPAGPPTGTAPADVAGPGNGIYNFLPRSALNRVHDVSGGPTPGPGQPRLVKKGSTTAPATIAAEGVTVSDLNRTFVNVGFGRDWYLNGPAPTYLNADDRGGCGGGGPVWRVGLDGGGRYGSAKLELHEIHHRTDTIAGAFIGAHADVEVPCGCCIFQAGVRVEYGYTWMDILQQHNDTDLSDVNLLFSAGVRF